MAWTDKVEILKGIIDIATLLRDIRRQNMEIIAILKYIQGEKHE